MSYHRDFFKQFIIIMETHEDLQQRKSSPRYIEKAAQAPYISSVSSKGPIMCLQNERGTKSVGHSLVDKNVFTLWEKVLK